MSKKLSTFIKKKNSSTQSLRCVCLPPHGLQHARPPCPSPTPGACSNSCPSLQWCPPTSHPLSCPSPAFNLSHHQALLYWVSSLHPMAKVLELQPQHQSFQEYSGLIFLRLTGSKSLHSKGHSRAFSSTTVWKHQFFGTQVSLWFNSHIHTWLVEKP